MSLDVVNPSTDEVIRSVPIFNKQQLDEKVQQAHDAQRPWEETPSQVRGNHLRIMSNRFEENREVLARQLSQETGKPLGEALDEVDTTVRLLRYYSEIGRLVQGGVAPMMTPKQRSYVLKEAVGVVGAILPFNFPLLLLTWKMAPALMAGCTMVVKPPHQNPLTALLAGELCFRELPPGVVVFVTGDGSTGSLMVEHPLIRMITFTGSTAVGRKIAERCGSMLKKYHLELGGMDPLVVLDDADIELAANAARWGRFSNNGQVCTSTKRIIVTNAVADRFVTRFTELVSALRQGDPLAGQIIDVGPVINKMAFDKIVSQIEQLKNEPGARLLLGGKRNPNFSKGQFLEPTVFDNLTSNSLANREEIFGPVACIFRVANKEEAFNLANATEYGLGGTVFTNRLDNTMEFIDNMKAGTIWVNDVITDNESAPFGGMKNSGDGTRELGGLESLECYRESKHVITDWNFTPKPYWFPYQ